MPTAILKHLKIFERLLPAWLGIRFYQSIINSPVKYGYIAILLFYLFSQSIFLMQFGGRANALSEVFRVTTYQVQSGEFTNLTYDLSLNNNLEPNYYAMISGPSNATAGRGPNQDFVRVSADPHSNFGSTTNADELQLLREDATNDWIGSVMVVECLLQCNSSGFELKEVIETSLPIGAANNLQTTNATLGENHTSNTVPFAARFGGGITTSSNDNNEYSTTLGVKVSKSGLDELQFERYGAENRTAAAATVVTYVVEWGNEWDVQAVNVTGTSSGSGLDSTSEYDTATINQVTRNNAWVWGSGFTRDDGLGDGAFGQAITLGDGVNQNNTETSVSVGGEGGLISPGRDFEVFVIEHPSLIVDYRFKSIGDQGSNNGYQELNITIDSANKPDAYDNSSPTVQSTEGYRAAIFYNTSSGTGQAYSRTGAWGLRIDSDTNLKYWRAYSGQDVTGWFQVVDFGDISYSNVNTRQQAFRWRDDSTALNTSGGWLAPEDGNLTSESKNSNLRLRIKVANFGTTPEDSSRTYELQYAAKSAGSCSLTSGWVGLEDPGANAFSMYDSSQINPDGQIITTGLLTNGESFSFVSGEARESTDTTSAIGPIADSSYTELEYSLLPTDESVTGQSYCFRLFDKTSASPLDGYSVYPEITISSVNTGVSGLGETGSFSSAIDGGWTTINFSQNYSNPVVVGTTNTQNGQAALVFESRNVTSNSAQMRVCESEGATANGCDTHSSETVGYMVIDADVASEVEGIEAGTFTANGRSDNNSVTTNYSDTYSSAPYVFANVNTVNSTEFPIEVVISSTSSTNFVAGICEHLQGSNDDCDATHGNETVGWVSLDPNNIPFTLQHEAGTATSTGGGNWASITFTNPFASAPVVIAASQTDTGTQDVEIDEARLVTTTGVQIRSCEIDTLDTCDTHNPDTMAWLAVDAGQLTYNANLDQTGYRFYENNNSLTPAVALGAEDTSVNNVNNGDVLRVRLAVQNGLVDIASGGLSLKLQYGQGSQCSAVASWNDIGDVGSGVIWRGFNAAPADGADLPSSLLDSGGNAQQTYQEQNPTAPNSATINATQSAEWDFVIENNGAPNFTSYCFRLITDAGDLLNYTDYPQLTTSSGVANLNPDTPTSLDQKTTSNQQIVVAEVINETTIKFEALVSDQNANDILQLCVETVELKTTFTDTETNCGSAVVYSGTAVTAEVIISGLVNDKSYHWQARVKDAAGLYSAWASFGANSEAEADHTIDTVAPEIFVYDGASIGVDLDYNSGSLSQIDANWSKKDGLYPDDINGLVLWLDGDDVNANGTDPSDGSAVTTWSDKSGNSNDITGTGAATFDDARQALAFNDTAQPFDDNYNRSGGNDNSMAVFSVVEGNGTTSNHVWFETTTPRVSPAENGMLGGGTTLSGNNLWDSHITDKQLMTIEYNSAGTSTAWLDNTVEHQFSETQTFAASQRLTIGDDTTGNNRLESGEFINEIIIFNQDVSQSQREQLWEHLKCKWNLKDCSVTYEYSIGTSPGGVNILSWQTAGAGTSFSELGLNLETSETYYVNVRVTDLAGNQAIYSSDGILVAPSLNFSLSTGVIDFDNLNDTNNYTDTKPLVLSITTNARNGYQVRSYATANLNGPNGSLAMFDDATYSAPASWDVGDYGYGYTSSDSLIDGVNLFNPTTCLGGGAPPCYAPFSTTAPGDVVADNQSTVVGNPITNEQFTITHRVTTTANQASGDYQTTVIYSASANY